MKLAICHYSFHRRWAQESWDVDRLSDEVEALGVEGIDYHARLLGSQAGAAGKVRSALERTGLQLSGFSLSTDFSQPPEKLETHIADTVKWLDVAAVLKAPVCRIFGGPADRSDPTAIEPALERLIGVLKRVVPEAESRGLVLALENHGGMPCTGEEQVRVIERVGSPALRATVDIGNYLSGGQDAVEGTVAAAKHAAYVHVKDYKKTAEGLTPAGGFHVESCTIGQGDVDVPGCVRALREAGYDGYLAVEYEGKEDEKTGVPASVEYVKGVLASL